MDKEGTGLAERHARAVRELRDGPAFVQPFACVIAVSDTWDIIAASDNCLAILGIAAEELLSMPFGHHFAEESVHRLRSQAQVLSAKNPVARLQGCRMLEDAPQMDVTATLSGGDIYFEFELAEQHPGLSTELEQIQRLIQRVARQKDFAQAMHEAARTLRAVCGFHRVTIHRMSTAGLGEPLGAALSLPLADLPSDTALAAHAANFCTHLHVVADLMAQSLPLRAAPDAAQVAVVPDARVLCSFAPGADLFQALEEGGVRAAMTLPIRVDGELWGIFVCHHAEVLLPTVGHRSAMALFSLLLGYEIERLDERLGALARLDLIRVRDVMIASLSEKPDFTQAVMGSRDALHDSIPHDGLVLWTQGQFMSEGQTITRHEFEDLFPHIVAQPLDTPWVIDRLGDLGIAADALGQAGDFAVLCVPVSRTLREYVLILRRVAESNDRSKNWQDWEIEAAEAMRSVMIEAQLKLQEDHAAVCRSKTRFWPRSSTTACATP